MKILIIGHMHTKRDKRVFKTVEMLSREHKVIYQYYSTEEHKSYQEGNITYIPLRYSDPISLPNKINFKVKLKNIKNLAKIEEKILMLIKEMDYDILYFHYFLTRFPLKSFKIAKKRNKKIIYDIHEYHPENYYKHLSGIKKALKEKIMWYILKKQFIMSDKLIFVSKEMKEDMYKILKIKKPYLIVPNYANVTLKTSKKEKEIVFVGKTPRNIDYEKEIINKLILFGFKFKIIGMDSEYFKDIPHEFTSFLPYEEMMKELSKASFSLVSYESFGNEQKNYFYSFPHKFFDSIAAGTPVIINKNFISMANEVKKHNIGVVIDPKDVNGSVQQVMKAYENYSSILENIEKFKNLYVWDKEKEKAFINFILN
ncbi:glycosyltransferase involved in cell wall biosynthesis [Thermosipho japonicus]|uniref:Glycosyltransferase involved in cell wall biosynthesis n=1 Tax=Thermosipho japonicus TaxID=90323 RepID=A0A841GV60_9BACT|nr:glycosyltransferase [Thermosipho japonicus]MBB6062791.1 glycosyltransferase involved in cell wall biosynthesis [Thermosipho japonicus]